MNDSHAKLGRRRQAHWLVPVVCSVACLACSSEPEPATGAPAFGPAPSGVSANPGAGGAGTGASGSAGNSEPARPSSEQPAAGSGTPIAGGTPAISAGAGGSMSSGMVATGGSAGFNMGAAGGSMVASGGAAGAAGQQGMPASTPCENGAFFCEDFEALALGALAAGAHGLQPERTVSVIAEPGRGQVLSVQAGAGYANKAGIFLNQIARPDNSHFGRMFVKVGAFPVAPADHWVIVEATGNGGDQVRPVGGQFQRWAPGADGASAGDWTDWQQSSAATAAGAWACVEWQVNGANGGNDLLLWVDDVQVRPMDRPGFTLPTFTRLWIGWVVYQMGAPSQYDVRIDDIVLSAQRIGCD